MSVVGVTFSSSLLLLVGVTALSFSHTLYTSLLSTYSSHVFSILGLVGTYKSTRQLAT